jgi:hypothetical protein
MNMLHKLLLPLAAAALAALSSTPAKAVIVNIDATVSGCDISHCNGLHLPPGSVLGAVINPVQLALGPGTYTITDGSGQLGANPSFTAWRYDGGPDWVWSFMVVDDATKSVLVQGCCGLGFNTQAGAATQPFAQNYSTTLTLPSAKTVDFIIEDYYLPDNAGGITLQVTSVPEPSSWLLIGCGLLGLAGWRKLRA